MLCKPETGDRARAATGRVTALDRARTFITLLVLIHHSAVNYTHFGNGDKMRWLGFDLVVLFNDSFFMACMFLISGLFVHDSLTPQGSVELPAASRVAARHSLSDFDLRADADCVLSDLPALSSARHHRLQFLSFLVAYADGRAMAVGSGMVPMGAARARPCRRRIVGAGAAPAEDVRLSDLFAARPAVDGVCGVPRHLGCGLCADAADLRR